MGRTEHEHKEYEQRRGMEKRHGKNGTKRKGQVEHASAADKVKGSHRPGGSKDIRWSSPLIQPCVAVQRDIKPWAVRAQEHPMIVVAYMLV